MSNIAYEGTKTRVSLIIQGTPSSQRTEMIAVRLEPRLRYLTEVAAIAKGLTLSGYVEFALQESFKSVTLRVPPEPEPIYSHDLNDVTMPEKPNDEEERAANEAMSVANLSEHLWSESEFVRLQNRFILARHTLSKEDEELLGYLHSRDDLKIPKSPSADYYKLNREKINSEWGAIRAAFVSQQHKKSSPTKVK
ncbi:MAG TPA: hypothetical protein VNX26_06980 [Candidatus Acidoferrum sp.]|nr:hypothetical protein [Candidatus Acidoferrum sp.]